jgi:hypothetical protein
VTLLFKFSEPIDEKRRDEIIEAIAKRIEQFGMLVPAIFFLEMNKPLSYITGQGMHFFAPIVGVFFNTFEDYAYFFDDRNNVELLIQKLESLAEKEEERARELKAQRKAKKAAMKAAKSSDTMMDEAIKMSGEDKPEEANNIDPK